MKKFIYGWSLLLFLSCDFQDEPTIPESVWEYALPEEAGVDGSRLSLVNNRIKDGVYGEISSLIIIKNDKLIFENYYNNADRNAVNPIWGSTTSVSSMLIGMTIDQGIIPDLDTPIMELLDNQNPFENPLKALITVRDLVSMRTGLAWNELVRSINDPNNIASRMSTQPNWASFTLNQEMEATPGARFAYNSGAMMVFSKIVLERTQKPLKDFAREHLFDPLGIETIWSEDPIGVSNAAWGLSITPTSMAKIGYLALKNGNWFGDQIISEEYVQEMGALQSRFTFTYDFGYGWWRFSDFNDLVQLSRENDIYFSWGNGGQFIFVIPHLDMVVVTTATNFGDFNEQLAFTMLLQEIIPASESSL